MNKKIIIHGIIVVIIVIFLLSFLVPRGFSEEVFQHLINLGDGQDFDWYNVDDELIQACYSDGGNKVSTYNNIEQMPTSGRWDTDINRLSYQNTITLQAQYQLTEEDKKDETKNKYLYEVAWYIQPFVENVEYTITMKSNDNSLDTPDIQVKETTGADAKVGDSGYWAEELQGKYNVVLVEYTQKGKEYEYKVDIKKR